jgi:hypothetical protein
MSRITQKETERLHTVLDLTLSKLNSSKNINKPHWSTLSLEHIQKMITVENGELDVAILDNDQAGKLTELKDILLYALFGLDNMYYSKDSPDKQ